MSACDQTTRALESLEEVCAEVCAKDQGSGAPQSAALVLHDDPAVALMSTTPFAAQCSRDLACREG
jgi:hypothetical protein